MRLRPIGNQLVVTPEKPREFQGAIFLPQKRRREPYHTAIVKAVGARVLETVSEGDRILVEGVVTGAKIPDSEDFVIVEDHVIAILEKETIIE